MRDAWQEKQQKKITKYIVHSAFKSRAHSFVSFALGTNGDMIFNCRIDRCVGVHDFLLAKMENKLIYIL
jgi:hypothetical protein